MLKARRQNNPRWAVIAAYAAVSLSACVKSTSVDPVATDDGFTDAAFSPPAVAINQAVIDGQGVVAYFRNDSERPETLQAYARAVQAGGVPAAEQRLASAGGNDQRMSTAVAADGTRWLAWRSSAIGETQPIQLARLAASGNVISNESVPRPAGTVIRRVSDPVIVMASSSAPGLLVYGLNNAVVAHEISQQGALGPVFDIERYASEARINKVHAQQNAAGTTIIGWEASEPIPDVGATTRLQASNFAALHAADRGVFGRLDDVPATTVTSTVAIGPLGHAVMRSTYFEYRLYDPLEGWQSTPVRNPLEELSALGCPVEGNFGAYQVRVGGDALVTPLIDAQGRITFGDAVSCVYRVDTQGVIDRVARLEFPEPLAQDLSLSRRTERALVPLSIRGGVLVVNLDQAPDQPGLAPTGRLLSAETVFDPMLDDVLPRELAGFIGNPGQFPDRFYPEHLALASDGAGHALLAFEHDFPIQDVSSLPLGIYTIAWSPPRPTFRVSPESALPGDTVRLIGSDVSANPDNALIVDWSWDIGNDGEVDGTGSSIEVDWDGTPVDVRLTVIDDWGITGSAVGALDLSAPDTRLTVEVIGNGTVTTRGSGTIDCGPEGGICTAGFAQDSRVVLDTAPVEGERFIQWGGDCASFGSIRSPELLMDRDYDCSATFSTPVATERVAVTVALELDGQSVRTIGDAGRVLGTGIDCGGPGPDCEQTVDVNSAFTLQVVEHTAPVRFNRWISPQPGSACDQTSSTRLEFVVDAPITCIAQYVSISGPQAELTVFISTDGLSSPFGGRVSSDPAGIEDCGDTGFQCSAMFNGATEVTLTATPRPGYRFALWSGDSSTPECAGSESTVTITMNGPRQCVALFRNDVASGDARILNILVDLPEADRPRVIDIGTGLIDCVGACSISVPIDQSPYLLRQTTPPGVIQSWSGCDALVPDPQNPGGLELCEVDISQQSRSIQVVAP